MLLFLATLPHTKVVLFVYYPGTTTYHLRSPLCACAKPNFGGRISDIGKRARKHNHKPQQQQKISNRMSISFTRITVLYEKIQKPIEDRTDRWGYGLNICHRFA